MIYVDEEAEARINLAYCREIDRCNAAVKAARKARPNVNSCMEYENAYVFFNTEDEPSDGGNDAVAVLKSTGAVLNFSACMTEVGEFERKWKC